LSSHGVHTRLLSFPTRRSSDLEYERTLIADRMRRGRQQKFRAGTLLPWSRPPYGYRLNPDRPRDPAGVRQEEAEAACAAEMFALDRKSTRLNSSHSQISYAVFC